MHITSHAYHDMLPAFMPLLLLLLLCRWSLSLCCRLFAKVSDQVWKRKTFLIFYHLLDNYSRCGQQQQQLTLTPGAQQVEVQSSLAQMQGRGYRRSSSTTNSTRHEAVMRSCTQPAGGVTAADGADDFLMCKLMNSCADM
jgi:hypothetical protein